MRVSVINHILELSVKHPNIQSALLGRGDKGVTFFHAAHKHSGDQKIIRFNNRDDVKRVEEHPDLADSIMILGYYVVPEAAWSLAETIDIYEMYLISQKVIPEDRLKSFDEQLMEKLIMSSAMLETDGDIPEDHELWRLCLTGVGQEPYVPSSDHGGAFSVIPGTVLADFTAPKGMASTVSMMLARELEVRLINLEKLEKRQDSFSGFFSSLFRFEEHDHDDDFGFDEASN